MLRALSLLLLVAACAPAKQCFVASVTTSADNEPVLVGRMLPCDHIKMLNQ